MKYLVIGATWSEAFDHARTLPAEHEYVSIHVLGDVRGHRFDGLVYASGWARGMPADYAESRRQWWVEQVGPAMLSAQTDHDPGDEHRDPPKRPTT